MVIFDHPIKNNEESNIDGLNTHFLGNRKLLNNEKSNIDGPNTHLLGNSKLLMSDGTVQVIGDIWGPISNLGRNFPVNESLIVSTRTHI